MAARQVFKKLLIPGAAVVGVAADRPEAQQCIKCAGCRCKPSELPIYTLSCQGCKPKVTEKPAGELENAIGRMRSELWVLQDGVKGYKQQVVDFVETGIAHSSSSVDFLREESHGPERAGAVALATLSGVILGLRGGIFKKLTYATISGLGMASVCYPREAAEYSEMALAEGNQYFVAGYHFLFGETPKLPDWAGNVLGGAQEKIKEVASKGLK